MRSRSRICYCNRISYSRIIILSLVVHFFCCMFVLSIFIYYAIESRISKDMDLHLGVQSTSTGYFHPTTIYESSFIVRCSVSIISFDFISALGRNCVLVPCQNEEASSISTPNSDIVVDISCFEPTSCL